MTDPKPIREFTVDKLTVRVFADRTACGLAAARYVAPIIRDTIASRGDCSLCFAAAPSQTEFLKSLAAEPDIDWSKTISCPIDEYLDIEEDDPRRLFHWMQQNFYDMAPVGHVTYLPTNPPDANAAAAEYARQLAARCPDIAFQGIGQSGHIAYNDPPVADFNDPLDVKVVEIDATSRQQQVTDGTVDNVADAIPRAYTMTVPMLLRPAVQSIVCPGRVKAPSVRRTLTEPISEAWPATALRTHDNAVLFTDADGASEVE